jgi:segregation and condensation protein B
MTDKIEPHLDTNLTLGAKIEALLFVALGVVKISQLSAVLGESVTKVESTINELEQKYIERGIRLQRHRGRVQLVSAPEAARDVDIFLDLEVTARLSQAALETLAIIAYQQPITRPQVDAIRGVNSDGVMKTLLSKSLIQEAGRTTGPGRPIIYNTTPAFLGYFGLMSLDELPPLSLHDLLNGGENGNKKILKE